MIIVRTPLRISIAGGGTDLSSYYSKFGSMFISAAINKYIYITYHRSQFDPKIRIRYARMEEVNSVDEVQNEIVRETLRACDIKDSVEFTSHAEIPSGTGLGSSGSFGVGILHALRPNVAKHELAKDSSHIQMDILNFPCGLQDQYVAAYGGFNTYRVNKWGVVEVSDIKVKGLEDNLVLFYTGIKRDANEILITQKENALEMEATLHKTQELCYKVKEVLEKWDFRKFGELMNEQWFYKKKRSPLITNPRIDELYELGLKNGAIGGKLIGAGGGGFLLFYTEDKEKMIKEMPLLHIPFKFDYEGSKVLLNE